MLELLPRTLKVNMSTKLLEPDIQDDTLEQADVPRPRGNHGTSPLDELTPQLVRRSTFVRWIAGVVILALAFGSGWWMANRRAHQLDRLTLPPSSINASHDAIVVTVSPIERRVVQRYVEAVGTLHGFEEVTLSSKQEGRVLKIFHDLSSVVQPGAPLLELDPTDAKLAYDQAERNVQTELAKGGFTKVPSESDDLSKLPMVVSSRLRFELAQSRLQRMMPLKSSNSISAEDFEQARSEALVLESDWQNQLLIANSAAATARLRNAELAIANQRLRDIVISAPTPTDAGTQTYSISERLVSEGTLVRPGTEVFRLVLGRTLKLKLSVPESHSGDVVVGQTVEILTGSTLQPTIGSVARIGPAIDRATRTFIVEVEVPNATGLLKPGGFAKARILISKDENATTIPLAGLYSFAGIHKVFLERNGTAQEIKVTLGEQSSDCVEIASPKLPGDSVVITSGQRLLSDGIAIAVRETPR